MIPLKCITQNYLSKRDFESTYKATPVKNPKIYIFPLLKFKMVPYDSSKNTLKIYKIKTYSQPGRLEMILT